MRNNPFFPSFPSSSIHSFSSFFLFFFSFTHSFLFVFLSSVSWKQPLVPPPLGSHQYSQFPERQVPDSSGPLALLSHRVPHQWQNCSEGRDPSASGAACSCTMWWILSQVFRVTCACGAVLLSTKYGVCALWGGQGHVSPVSKSRSWSLLHLFPTYHLLCSLSVSLL